MLSVQIIINCLALIVGIFVGERLAEDKQKREADKEAKVSEEKYKAEYVNKYTGLLEARRRD